MQKNTLSKLLLIFSVSLICSFTTFAQNAPTLFLNGELKNVDVILKNSATLIPLRFCSEQLNANVKWDQTTQEIMITKGSDTLLFKVGSLDYSHNNESKKLLFSPELVNGVTYVPFRPLVDSLNGVVLYNHDYKFINIYDTHSEAYKVYLSFNSNDLTEKRFAMLESPKLNFQEGYSYGGNHGDEYIFPRGKASNYFFRQFSDEGTFSGIAYFEIHDGVAIEKWRRTQSGSSPVTSNKSPILNYFGDGSDIVEVGEFPPLIDTSFVSFYNNTNESSKDIITQISTMQNTISFIDSQGFYRPNVDVPNSIVFSPFGSMYYLMVFEE